MKSHELRDVMERAPDFVSPDGQASFWIAEPFQGGMTWIGRFSGQSPWERHPDGDELLHVLVGEVEITVLADEGAIATTIPAGSVFVVPRGRWHRQSARSPVTQFGATVGGTEHSDAEDPRRQA